MNLEMFYDRLPFCASWIGARRSGKSLSAAMVVRYLVQRNAFRRVILFIGTKYCNPELVNLIKRHFDERLIFYKYTEELLFKIIGFLGRT